MVDHANAPVFPLEHLKREERGNPAIDFPIEAGARATVRSNRNGVEAVVTDCFRHTISEEAGHRIATADPGRMRWHREGHVVVQKGDDRVEITLLPGADVALQQSPIEHTFIGCPAACRRRVWKRSVEAAQPVCPGAISDSAGMPSLA